MSLFSIFPATRATKISPIPKSKTSSTGTLLSTHDNTIAFKSMGQLNYLSALKFMDAIVGNSSSGLIEAPSFKIGTINIGDRQNGRIKAKSVIDCSPNKKSIKEL
mgnify:CR=1 FL=1